MREGGEERTKKIKITGMEKSKRRREKEQENTRNGSEREGHPRCPLFLLQELEFGSLNALMIRLVVLERETMIEE